MEWLEQINVLALAVARSYGKAGGAADPKAVQKYEAELQELRADIAAGDCVGALTELADVVYYAGKAVLVGSWPEPYAHAQVYNAIALISPCYPHISFALAVSIASAKYRARALNNRLGLTKTIAGDILERAACARAAGVPFVTLPQGYGERLKSVVEVMA